LLRTGLIRSFDRRDRDGGVRDVPASAGKLSCSLHPSKYRLACARLWNSSIAEGFCSRRERNAAKGAGGPDRANYAENGGTFGQRFFIPAATWKARRFSPCA